MRSLFLLVISLTWVHALPFSLIKHEGSDTNQSTLLVIGGIHGNEPGSYFAASILSEYYTLTKGNLWVVPNLNHASIMMNSRGINGDMNRKFAEISSSDLDYSIVEGIKKVITDPQVDLILNLHDGHGFYRKEYKNTIFNPGAWGQTCVIDQRTLNTDHRFKDLDKIASAVSAELNGGLIENHHCFDVRNTNTKFDDEAMKHSLTYFAINNNKPAFAIETSKNLPTLHEKVFYQLRAIEGYMRYAGIVYKREFELTPDAIKELLTKNGELVINDTSYFNLTNIKKSLSFIPLKSNGNGFAFSHPLGGIIEENQKYTVYIGNRKICSLSPTLHAVAQKKITAQIELDGKQEIVDFAKEYFVNADFKVITDPETRVNIIGFTPKGTKDESNLNVSLKDLDPKYSIDTESKVYRAEFYQGDTFYGMILIHFN